MPVDCPGGPKSDGAFEEGCPENKAFVLGVLLPKRPPEEGELAVKSPPPKSGCAGGAFGSFDLSCGLVAMVAIFSIK